MLVYLAHGPRDYRHQPVRGTERGRWEFQAVLRGHAGPTFTDGLPPRAVGRRLWAFGPRCAHGWGSPEPGCEVAVAHFDQVPTALSDAVAPDGYASVGLTDADAERVALLLNGLADDYRRPTALSALRSDHAVLELSLLLLRDRPAAPLPGGDEQARRKVAQALAWYAEHLTERPTVEQVAEGVFVSPSHLRRLFAQAGQGSPLAAMHALQLARARDLLRQRELTLAEVAAASGFSAPSVFSRSFRAATSESPRAWRRRHGG